MTYDAMHGGVTLAEQCVHWPAMLMDSGAPHDRQRLSVRGRPRTRAPRMSVQSLV